MATGTFFSVFGLLFLHQKEAAMLGVCRWIFGKDVLISTHPWPVVDPFVYALPLSIIALVVVSLLTSPPEKEHIARLFKR